MNISLMHVTTVPQTLGFFRGQVGHLVRNGFRVTVLSSPGPLLDRFGAEEPVTAVAVPMSRPLRPVADLASLLRLVRVVLRHKPDIVHSHTPKAALLGTLAARLTGRPAVLSIFGLPQMTCGSAAIRWLLDAKTRLECALAHRVWCDSFSVRQVLIDRRLCRPDKIVVLGNGSVNGVDAERRFNPARFSNADREALRRRWHIPADTPVIGFVGRIVRDKGIRELAAAWKTLRGEFPTLHLLMVGEFEAIHPIDAETDQILRHDERVHFAGAQHDVTPFFAIMDVFAMPSYREGFGVTNLEAAAMAVPVVSTLIPGCVDSVADGRTGTLVPPQDAGALAAAIAGYLNDPVRRRVHGDAGRQRALDAFMPSLIWSQLAELYRTLVNPITGERGDTSGLGRRRTTRDATPLVR